MEETPDQLRAEIGELMEQVMASLGTGTMVLPEEIQRGMSETTHPSLDEPGLRSLRDELRALLPR